MLEWGGNWPSFVVVEIHQQKLPPKSGELLLINLRPNTGEKWSFVTKNVSKMRGLTHVICTCRHIYIYMSIYLSIYLYLSLSLSLSSSVSLWVLVFMNAFLVSLSHFLFVFPCVAFKRLAQHEAELCSTPPMPWSGAPSATMSARAAAILVRMLHRLSFWRIARVASVTTAGGRLEVWTQRWANCEVIRYYLQ